MTDRPGGPSSPGTPARPTGGAWGTPTPAPAPRRRHRWLRWVALGMTVLMLTAAGVGWTLYQRLDSNITTDTDTADELARWEKERPVALVQGAQNILIIGSDTRGAGNGAYGTDSGTQRSDTTILLHLAADRRSATAVSLPRDLMAKIPSCRQSDGSRTNERFAQFNWAYELAGAACTIRTVENITRIRVDHHVIVDFNGFKRLVDAIDGVEVCLKQPVDDQDAKLRLPAGRQVLRGEAALGYVRARYSLGNGSDTERMGRQQEFLGSLFREMQSSGVLLNPARLYPVLDAATSSLTTDAGLDTLRKLYDLVRTVRDIPSERVQFLTVPRRPYVHNNARDELVQPDADQLFEQLRNDRPVAVGMHVRAADNKPRQDQEPVIPVSPQGTAEAGTTEGQPASQAPPAPADPGTSAPATGSPKPTTPPTYEGTTAARGMCG
ncbi:LCP family protein [Streptomyces syringium]|uniref:LCP family protein n=1 Tax=Streptomyces syringium TaxID=76729 RepID=UPI0033B777A0